MALPSVTYSFSNGTTSDATQVNTNFTDVINAMTDGTKSFTIDALTCNGAVTLKGAVTLGDGSPDDITFTGSLASSIPIKTNASFDIGSATLGLAGVYLGSSGSHSTRLVGAATTSYTLTLPTTAGSAGQVPMNTGSGTLAFLAPGPAQASNYAIACSVSSSALTVSLKAADGTDPSSSNPVYVAFRNATSATGTPTIRSVTSALSVTVSSGSTLGHTDSGKHYIYVYLYDNSGTLALAVSSSVFDEGCILSSITAEGGAGAADSISGIYATSSANNVPIRLIARLLSTQTTAGTWAAVPTEISLAPFRYRIPPTIQKFTSGSGTYTTPTSPKVPTYIRVRMVGGGGGGSGSGSAGTVTGGTGGNSTFGTSLLTANGGTGGGQQTAGSGGSTTMNSPAIGINMTGSAGVCGTGIATAAGNWSGVGGAGGTSPFGGAGAAGGYAAGGSAGATNSGSGGGGASTATNSGIGGGGGGSGGYIDAIIYSPSATYSYAVGGAGTAGSAGTGGSAGGAGAAGIIVVEEYYE